MPPPGGNGAIMRTGLVGYFWADATGAAATASTPAAMSAIRFMRVLLVMTHSCGATLLASLCPRLVYRESAK